MTVNSVINSLENKVLDDILKPINHPVSRIPGLEFDSEYATIDDFEAFFSYYFLKNFKHKGCNITPCIFWKRASFFKPYIYIL